jgi:hypothetical protein
VAPTRASTIVCSSVHAYARPCMHAHTCARIHTHTYTHARVQMPPFVSLRVCVCAQSLPSPPPSPAPSPLHRVRPSCFCAPWALLCLRGHASRSPAPPRGRAAPLVHACVRPSDREYGTGLLSRLQERCYCPAVLLNQQYRMDPAIAAWPNRMCGSARGPTLSPFLPRAFTQANAARSHPPAPSHNHHTSPRTRMHCFVRCDFEATCAEQGVLGTRRTAH